jgi:hypothetical protein
MGHRAGVEEASGGPVPGRPGRPGRLARWTRRLTGVAAAVPVFGAIVAAAAAWRALAGGPALVVTALCVIPAVLALVLRARAVWLVEAVPALLTELRTLADRSDAVSTAAGDRVAAALRSRSDEVHAMLEGTRRRSPGALVRTYRLLRSPAEEAMRIARTQLGDGAAASLSTTAGALARMSGLLPLAWAAAIGTAVVWAVAVVLLLAGTL